MRQRIIFDIIVFVSLFTLAPWYVLALATLGSFFFQKFYEIIAVGIALDGLYGIYSGFPNIPIVFTAISCGVFIATFFFKDRLRFYQ